MSAANASAPSPSIHEEMRAHEPSMEEILASIRRIIADDDTLPGARRERDERRRRDAERAIAEPTALAPEAAAPEAASQPEPVAEAEPQLASAAKIRSLPLRLNRAPEPVQLVEETIAEEEDDYVEEPELSEPVDFAPEAPADEVEEESSEIVEYEGEDAPLVSAEAASSVASQFQTLAASMILNDSGLLQKYAQEMLRPMLKQWLDDNLPTIVERLVRAEIERVARGGRR